MSSVRYSKKHQQLLVQIGYVENGLPSLKFHLHPHFFGTTDFDSSLAFGTERHLFPLSLCLTCSISILLLRNSLLVTAHGPVSLAL